MIVSILPYLRYLYCKIRREAYYQNYALIRMKDQFLLERGVMVRVIGDFLWLRNQPIKS